MNQENFSNIILPKPTLTLPISGPAFERPDPALIEQLKQVSSATASAMLHRMGMRQTFIQGPLPQTPGKKVVGPTVTLQFMPQREDIASGLGQEDAEKKTALWDVFDTVQPGDILAVQAFGDVHTGCIGEMLVTYFMERGGVGIVVDGCVRDWAKIQEIGTPLWARGSTPNYASQSTLYPWACNVPIACSRVTIIPGDIIIADDDGAVMVPINVAPLLIECGVSHEDWEVFSRIKLAEGGSLKKYYPLDDEAQIEYEAWREAQG